MFSLYGQYYDGTCEELFLGDLENKEGAILLLDHDEQVRGFSTFALLDYQQDGRPFRAIFSGDTIIHHQYWGEQGLALTWIRNAGQIWCKQPDIPLYWFLIVKGHRTYRYLPAFALRYWPHWSEQTPQDMQAKMDLMAVSRFGDRYEPSSGVVHFPRSRGHLKPAWANVDEADLRRPEVRHFLRCNPGYHRGDELVCLAELHADNLRPFARRVFTQGFPQ